MNLTNIFSVAAAVLASLGGGAVIIFAFSNWLGKVWANRLMERDRAQYEREIESLKSELLRDTESYKVKLRKSEFIFQKEFEAALNSLLYLGACYHRIQVQVWISMKPVMV